MTRHLRWAILCAAVALAAPAGAAGVTVLARTPSSLTVVLDGAAPGRLYRVAYDDGARRFVWENLSPDAAGVVVLRDDKHLRPEYRLRCESRIGPMDPVVFDDRAKGPIVGTRRLPFGVPVSTFGGAGYLVPGVSDLRRDDYGNFWLYLDRPPYAILAYGPRLDYRFALLMPDRILAHDLDAEGNLWVLHPENWVSKHSPLGETLGAWELPLGRGPGEFMSASGLAVDRDLGLLYLADEDLGRVQRFDLDLRLRPFPHTPWGWIGREDLAYRRPGKYDRDSMYYQLDRPRQLRWGPDGRLYVSSEHYVSRFDLADGRQVSFGRNPVLGWGGTFSDSPLSRSAALDGHWQRHWLAGVDELGHIYIADRENDFVVDPRLQVFSPEGVILGSFSLETEVREEGGGRVYITAVAGLASSGGTIWLVDAAGRIYQGPPGRGLRSGGRLFLGPGAAGRQFDLTGVEEEAFSVEEQAERVRHRSEGVVLAFPAGEQGTGNCEREGRSTLATGERSMWTPARLGEPFRVTLYDGEGREIPEREYAVEYEEKAGLFGTQYDYFRVANLSGRELREVRFSAEVQ